MMSRGTGAAPRTKQTSEDANKAGGSTVGTNDKAPDARNPEICQPRQHNAGTQNSAEKPEDNQNNTKTLRRKLSGEDRAGTDASKGYSTGTISGEVRAPPQKCIRGGTP
ncbi:hypothetical protein CYMTET_45220 [Cymbomonas tetramitiformis]|uniref:Uncharacterized protein n=1 Tax=Cymbomonas tetramitiformis TaxID=36881 RepID=A0AAE0EYI6_9CHLO|nr:hypothetical protein CYMTET_45220 [Cymbomonas tetramitiformis]